MCRITFIIVLISSFLWGNTQPETVQETLRIKAKDLTKEDQNSTQLFNLSPVRGLTNKNVKITMGIPPIDGFAKKERGITTQRDVVDPTWDVKQQFVENKVDVSKYNKDYYLGDIATKSKYIRLICRDHEYEDGDRIKLILNKATIHPNIVLRNAGYVIDIDLEQGLNTIEFYALNEGASSPNTAELKVIDENGIVIGSGQWLLTTGYKARLIVLRN
ncbi:MAG: hypothetical protein ACON4B_08560 [Flavobacteriaceae bacterium]